MNTRLHATLLGLACILALGATARSQAAPAAPEGSGLQNEAQQTGGLLVTDFYSSETKHPKSAGLGDRLTIKVNRLSQLIKESEEKNAEIILYLDDYPIQGLYPVGKDPDRNELKFDLQRTADSAESWVALLGQPTKLVKPVSVSVGLEGGHPIETKARAGNAMGLVVIRGDWLWVCIIGGAVVSVCLWRWGTRSQMLRDSGPTPPEGKLRPYSLARWQMALWFLIVLLSFLLIWAITGDYDTISSSVLVMMGISAGTALGVALQDQGKESESERLTRIAALEASIAAAATPAAKAALQEDLAKLTPTSEGFFSDVLTDAKGASLHRFQMFVWTLVLALIFGYEVYNKLAMPDFGATLLALMGVSSGTYLGFMIPEGHSAEQSKA